MEGKKKAKKDKAPQRGAKETAKPKGNRNVYLAMALFAVLIALVAIFLYLSRPPPATFQEFRHDFDGAPHVSIYVQDYNASFYIRAEGCATTLIQQLVGNSTAHRASSTISFYVINQTSCLYLSGLGSSSANMISATPQECIGQSRLVPSILLNYSPINSTSVEGEDLMVQGSAAYIEMCGVSSQLP